MYSLFLLCSIYFRLKVADVFPKLNNKTREKSELYYNFCNLNIYLNNNNLIKSYQQSVSILKLGQCLLSNEKLR